jgi:L-lysine 2,3-aminomutase
MDKLGSPNRSIHRTFRAIFELPVTQIKHNLIKIDKRKYRNPIYLAKEWQEALNCGRYISPAALARHLNVSRARVTQIINLLRLSPEVIEIIYSLGDPINGPIIAERRLRPLFGLVAEKQMAEVKIMLSKGKYK